MRIYRLFVDEKFDNHQQYVLDRERSHYLKNVLRAKIGREIRLFNSSYQEVFAKIEKINRHEITLNIIKIEKTKPLSKLDITLVQAISKGERMDYTVQKATELGIQTIQPIFSEYCDVKLDSKRLANKLSHWRKIAMNASEQSFRTDVPNIISPISINQYTEDSTRGLFLEPNETNKLGPFAENRLLKFDVVVGPEGGWSNSDIELLKVCGLQGVNFGPRILRTETVAPAVLAAIHVSWGDFC